MIFTAFTIYLVVGLCVGFYVYFTIRSIWKNFPRFRKEAFPSALAFGVCWPYFVVDILVKYYRQ